MRSAERMNVNVLEMKCWRSLIRVSRMNRIMNDEVRRRAGIERELVSKADPRVLRKFEHMERIEEYRMAGSVLMTEVGGGPVRGRPRLGWMDCAKVALGNRGMAVEAARQCTKKIKGKVFYVQEPPSGESVTTECSFNYQLLAVIY